MNYSYNQNEALRQCFIENFNVSHLALDLMDMIDNFDIGSLNDYITEQFVKDFSKEEIKPALEKYLSGEELDEIVNDILAEYEEELEEEMIL